ncbi:MAG TPA: pyridoxal-phosphate dependent enzyme [Methylomirabilota bacterium]
MAAPARVQLALAPTPILKLDRFSRRLGVDLYVKRDDLTGLLESGNKIRKLEFLVGDALEQGADTLIAGGLPQSNGCRAVAAVAARLGLRALLVVKGARPSVYDGNLLLDRLLGAQVRYCRDAEGVADVMDALAAEVRERGGRPYVIPESGANEVGALGYLECAAELAEQIHHGAPRFDAVVISAFTGGSQAGLLLGKQLAGLPGEIVGVPIESPAGRVRDHVERTMRAAIRRYGFAIEAPRTVHLLESHGSDDRGRVAEADLGLIADVASAEGMVLDPVYTARGFRALMDTLARDPKALGPRVCFIHTGGLYSLFPFRERLTAVIDGGASSKDC